MSTSTSGKQKKPAPSAKQKSSQEQGKNTKTKKNLIDYKASHPYGFGRYESIAKHTFYIHTEAFRQITFLCRRSRLPKYLWFRVEKTFLNTYGLTKLDNGLIVQEEIGPHPDSGLQVRVGMSELLEDYVNCLDESLNENEGKVIKLIQKWEKIAKELQKEFNSKAKVGEQYDNTGRVRVQEDISKEAIEWS